MQLSVQVKEGLARELTITIPNQEVNQAIDQKVQELQRSMRLPGFRPGKTPVAFIKKKYKEPIQAEVTERLVKETLQKALTEKNLEPVSMPKVDLKEMAGDKDLTFSAQFEIFPEVELADFSKLKLKKAVVEPTQEEIDRMLEKMREQKAEYKEVERAAQMKDRVRIDFEGKINGEAFEHGSGQDFELVLGSETTIKGFEEGIVGHGAGESFEVDVTFPENYGSIELAGKPATFHMTLKRVEESSLPPLDDSLAQLFDIQEGGLDKLKEQVLDNMQNIAKQLNGQRLKEQVMSQLAELHEFLLPQTLIDQEQNALQSHGISSDSAEEAGQAEVSPEQVKEAAKRVKLGIISRKIIDEYQLTPQREDLEAKINDLTQGYGDPDMMREYLMKNQQFLMNLHGQVLEDLLVKKITELASVEDEKMSYDTLMDLAKQG